LMIQFIHRELLLAALQLSAMRSTKPRLDEI
jgi:hypothetical protein